MLWGAMIGSLELRQEGGETRLTASFPYNRETEIAPGRREIIAPGAFEARINGGDEIHLLSGHDYAKPLASRSAGTLDLRETGDGLEVEARIDGSTSWAHDFLAANRSGLVKGLSPGFRVSRGGERIERRSSGVVRTITAADLFEISAVTRPAYSEAQIEARDWSPVCDHTARAVHALNRWRL